MIDDKLDDPDDALSFSGVMLMPQQVAEKGRGDWLDKPEPVLRHPAALGAAASLASSRGIPALLIRADAAG